ncbi:MAG: sialidase family protein [Bryobacteraceae bacterium]
MSRTRRPADVRNHSALGIDPANPDHLVEIYQSVSRAWGRTGLIAYTSFDGGRQWRKAAPFRLPDGAAGLVDPAVAWDDCGRPYVAALALRSGTEWAAHSVLVYASPDGGLTWSAPSVLEAGERVHQPSAAWDANSASPNYGRVYVAWCAGGQLRFASGGESGWERAELAANCFCPEILVAPDGAVMVAWLEGQAGTRIEMARSEDGGRRFGEPEPVATGITSLRGSLPESEGWPHFPGANFRVLTVPAGVTTPLGGVIFAWADFRDGISRIYYRTRPTAEDGWQAPEEGRALLSGPLASAPDQQEFLPRLMITPLGEVCCAFYEYGPKAGRESELVDLILAVSSDGGRTFQRRMVITEDAWNPNGDAPAGGTRGGMAWLKLR